MSIRKSLQNFFDAVEDETNYPIKQIGFKPVLLFENTAINAIKTNDEHNKFYIHMVTVDDDTEIIKDDDESIWTNFYTLSDAFLAEALQTMLEEIINPETTNDDLIIRQSTITNNVTNTTIVEYTLFIDKHTAVVDSKQIKTKEYKNKDKNITTKFKFKKIGETFDDNHITNKQLSLVEIASIPI